jgi:hypothetical protein
VPSRSPDTATATRRSIDSERLNENGRPSCQPTVSEAGRSAQLPRTPAPDRSCRWDRFVRKAPQCRSFRAGPAGVGSRHSSSPPWSQGSALNKAWRSPSKSQPGRLVRTSGMSQEKPTPPPAAVDPEQVVRIVHHERLLGSKAADGRGRQGTEDHPGWQRRGITSSRFALHRPAFRLRRAYFSGV